MVFHVFSQHGIAHQVLIHFAGAAAALDDIPDDKGLAAVHVSGGEDAGNIGSVVVRPFFGQDSPAGGKLYAEGPGCIGLTACKAGCDQQNITGNDLLSSCKLAEFSVLELYLNGTDSFQDTFFQNQLPDSCPEDPGINAVAGARD